jgi:hypothetical protein
MYKSPLLTIAFVALGLGACSEDPIVPIDNSVPAISKLEGASEIHPRAGQVLDIHSHGIYFNFNVSDPEGVAEVSFDVKGDFPRHSESSYFNEFDLFNYTIVLNEDSSDVNNMFRFGAATLNFDPVSIDWAGSYSVAKLPILAGPYDITVNAKDINGNQTNVEDGTGYQTTIYVERYYSPLIYKPHGEPEVVSVASNEALAIERRILKTDAPNSTPLKFIWIKLADKDVVGDYKGDTDQVVYEERMWGQSLRLEKSGNPLPSVSELTFNQLFEMEPIDLPTGKSDLVLIVWAEDEAGNVSRKAIPIEVN